MEKEKSKLSRQLETSQDKLSLIKESKEREIKDLNRKIGDMTTKYQN